MWFFFIVEPAPCGWGWTSGLSKFPGWGSLRLCSDGWIWVSSLWSAMKCPVVSFEVSMGLAWLWAACLLMLRAMFLLCWRIRMVCLALELVGSWVELGFQCRYGDFWVSSCLLMFPGIMSSLMFSVLELSLMPLAFSPSLTVTSRLLYPYSTDDKTPRLIVKKFSTVRDI